MTLASNPLRQIVPVTVFIDWNSQIHAAKPPKMKGEIDLASRTLEFVGARVARTLVTVSPDTRFDVTLRIYHGWHRGFEITPRRKALVSAAAGAAFLSNKSNVIIRADIEFGDLLISAATTRLHSRLGCHLPNTLRKALHDPEKDEEKMIDTAIASDVVDMAHRERSRWLMVVGEDDDLVPPVFVADGIRGGSGGRVVLLRSRSATPFLKMHDIRIEP